jgi:hypothetical protein
MIIMIIIVCLFVCLLLFAKLIKKMGWVFTDGVQENMSTDDADDVSGASKVPGPTPAKTS